MGLQVGIDVGGTFTDVFAQNLSTGQFWIAKTPTTPANQSLGVIDGIGEICSRAGVEPKDFDTVLHGTTVTTNAVLEGRGADVGLLVTGGWRHILHLGTSWTPGPLFGFFDYVPPEPLVPFEKIREISERIRANGEILKNIDPGQVASEVDSLLAMGVESITVSLLNSYINPSHEQQVKDIAESRCEALGMDVPISISSDVSPEFREFPRTITAIMNSYLAPVMERYLAELEGLLGRAGVRAPLQVVRSDGGLMSVSAARRGPVQTALSGPSGGVNGAAFVAKRAGFENILTFDMGGTSTDVAVCFDGIPAITRETRVGAFPVRVPAVDVETIGAGGGSIADVSEVTGSLRVGPASSGAEPGPACYGRGGKEATVTDANVVLGHLPPSLLGGTMTLDVELATSAVQDIAEDLGVDVFKAAQAIIDIVNGNMLGALRVATVQKGLDPTDFALVAFGGAGGLHANALAESLGSYPIVVPPEPGVLSALGFVAADVQNEFAMAFKGTIGDLDISQVRERCAKLSAKSRSWLTGEGVADSDSEVISVLDMRYQYQGYEITVEFTETEIAEFEETDLVARYHEQHERLYGFALSDGTVEVVNLRSRAVGHTEKSVLVADSVGDSDPRAALIEMVPTYEGEKSLEMPVYDRTLLTPGNVIHGKAVIKQYDSTTLVLTGHRATIDQWSNILIDREAK